VAAHVNAFSKLGVKVDYKNGYYDFVLGKNLPKRAKIWQLEASVTGTENLILLASGLNMELEIIDAASEPHVTDLLRLVRSMGVKVRGMGSNRLKIRGGKVLGGASFKAVPDYIDIGGLMAATGITNGEVLIKGANMNEVVGGLMEWYCLFGLEFIEKGSDLLVRRSKRGLRIKTDTGFPMAGEKLPKLNPRPWPGFPVDAIPAITTLACKAYGRVMIHNWMYESGFDFVRELNRLGAGIFMADPQRIIVPKGRVKFKGGEVAPPPVIQGTKAVFLAALADSVETIVHGIDTLKRRYPDIVETYKSLGADIEWV
jgi:UDP-N-acetylglucosamine 1-carboxyvinyltransferase